MSDFKICKLINDKPPLHTAPRWPIYTRINYTTASAIPGMTFPVIFLSIIVGTINVTPTEIISFYLGIKKFCVIPLALRFF